MSGNDTVDMVETRTTSRNQETTMKSLHTTIEEMARRMEQLQNEMMRMRSGEGTSNGLHTHGGRNGGGVVANQYGRMSKIEFPRFNGDDVKSWLFRCKHFFKIDEVQEEMKVELAAMHLSDRALVWHQQFLKKYGDGCPWEFYAEQVLKRFGSVFEDPMVELKNLKQSGTVQAYQDQFEDLLNRLELPKSLAISLFIGGLKDEISLPVRMFKPITLVDLFTMAKMQEKTNSVNKQRYTPILPTPKANPVNNYNNRSNTYVARPNNASYVNNGSSYRQNQTPYKRLTQKEIEEKRSKNLCFYCDQKYVPGHKCSGQLHSLEIVADEEFENMEEELINEDMGQMGGSEQMGEFEHNNEMMAQISLNALTGVYNYQTMRVKGLVGRQNVHVLVDCGSTHNFIDVQTAKKLGCRTKRMCPLQVAVANGDAMISTLLCQGLSLTMGELTYTIDAMILPLGGSDMVLGIQWLATLGTIQCNFANLTMEYYVGNKKVMLRGAQQAALQWMHPKLQFKATLNSMAVCVCPVSLCNMEGVTLIEPQKIDEVLDEFKEVFEVATSLPPKRTHDHQIPLLPNTPPINIRLIDIHQVKRMQ